MCHVDVSHNSLTHIKKYLNILTMMYICRSFWYLQRNGVPFSSLALKFGNYPEALTSDLLNEAQSVYFFTLVVTQWGCVATFLSLLFAWEADMFL